MRRIVVAGSGSHCGKTTIACGLLEAFRHKGVSVSAYKTGPDYIDPQFLRRAGNCEAYNLDTWLMSEERTRQLFARTSRGSDIAIIEGAMGLYDGGHHSTAEIAKLLRAPVVLIVDAKSLGESAAAVALGFREYDHDVNLAGVILNRVGSDYHEKIIADELERLGIKYLGALRRNDELVVPERHLGLNESAYYDSEKLMLAVEAGINLAEMMSIEEGEQVRPCEGEDLGGGRHAEVMSIEEGEQVLPCEGEDLGGVMFVTLPPDPLPLSGEGETLLPHNKLLVQIAVARDEAFTFYYPESLSVLEELGAELVYFSPLHDDRLPKADGYIFGGGFPEMFARELSGNESMLASVRENARPLLAECGGYMYLCRSLRDFEGTVHSMAGVIPSDAVMTKRPVLGYMEARALRRNILCDEGTIIRGHEFHYSRIESENDCAFELTRRNTRTSHLGGYASRNILASYLHINLFGNEKLAERFILSCIDFKHTSIT